MTIAGGAKTNIRSFHNIDEIIGSSRKELEKLSTLELLAWRNDFAALFVYDLWDRDEEPYQKQYDLIREILATREHIRTKAQAKKERQMKQRAKQNR